MVQHIGALKAPAIDAAMAPSALRMVDRRGATETSMRLHQGMSAVSVYATLTSARHPAPAMITRPARE
ncbi:phage integrase central domain-containing protein [Agrobacterium sp. 22-226-1]